MFALMRAVMRDVVALLCDRYANYVAQDVVEVVVHSCTGPADGHLQSRKHWVFVGVL